MKIVQNSVIQRNTFNFSAFWNCGRSNFENQFNISISTLLSTNVFTVNDCSTSFVVQKNMEYTINVSICANGLYDSIFYFGNITPITIFYFTIKVYFYCF